MSTTNIGYKIRIAQLEGYDEIILSLSVVADYGRILGVKHIGDSKENPHWHLVIETSVKEKAFRKRMNALFTKGKGNGHCSISPYDKPGDEPYSYMFHEGTEEEETPIFINKGHSEDDIKRYRKMNEDVQVLVNKAKEKASWRLEKLAYDWFVKNRGHKCCPTQEDVGIKIMELAFQNGIYQPQDWLLKAMVLKLCYELSDEVSIEYLIRTHVRRALRLD